MEGQIVGFFTQAGDILIADGSGCVDAVYDDIRLVLLNQLDEGRTAVCRLQFAKQILVQLVAPRAALLEDKKRKLGVFYHP